MKSVVLLLLILSLSACDFYKIPQRKKLKDYPKFTESDTLIGALSELRSCFDVKYYDLDLNFEAPKRFVSGTVDIHFNVVTTTNLIQIDLAEHLEISQIMWKNQSRKELKFTRKLSAVFIDFDETLPINSPQIISISYSGKPQKAKRPPWRGGFDCKRQFGKPFMAVACEDDGGHIWWPLKDHISDKPDSCQTAFTVQKGLTAVGNGRLISAVDSGDKTKFTWRTSYPINSYNITFYIGDYVHFYDTYEGEYSPIKLDYYVLPKNLEKAKHQFKQVPKILKVYEKYFGPYPWPKDGYKLVESPYAGMEHQTAIAYGAGYKDKKWPGYDYIILHETAHEWWGNAVTVCDMADLWLHEGFATYSEMIYEEEVFGKDRYLISYIINRKYSEYKRPIVGPMNVSFKDFKDNDIYSKGAAVLAMLRIVINEDDTFFKIIYRFATEYTKNCATTQDFIALVNEETKLDYNWFFDQYVFRAEAPELIYYYVAEQNQKDAVYYKWNKENTNENFKLSFPLLISRKSVFIEPGFETKRLELSSSQTLNFDYTQFIIYTNAKGIP